MKWKASEKYSIFKIIEADDMKDFMSEYGYYFMLDYLEIPNEDF